MYQKCAALRANPRQNKRDQIIKRVQDSYAGFDEPVDTKATVANAKYKAEELISYRTDYQYNQSR